MVYAWIFRLVVYLLLISSKIQFGGFVHAQLHKRGIRGDGKCAAQRRLALFATVKLRTLHTSDMGSQMTKNTKT